MNNISYTITVYNEFTEFNKLLNIIKQCKTSGDEIVVLHTFKESEDLNTQLFKDIKNIAIGNADIYQNFHFQNKFADLKNALNSLATKDYIFNFDADEICSNDTIKLWKNIILQNNNDLYYVPRINTVSNYTIEDIQEYKWTINNNGWINWPDYQPRIFKNSQQIKWVGNVHESIVGYKNAAALPADPQLAIIHHKSIQRQRQQNALYETIQR